MSRLGHHGGRGARVGFILALAFGLGVLVMGVMAAMGADAAKDELEKALTARMAAPVSLASAKLRFEIDPASGCWSLLDARSGVRWYSSPRLAAFGRARIDAGAGPRDVELKGFEVVTRDDSRLVLAAHPVEADKAKAIRLTFALTRGGDGLDMSFEPVGLNVAWLRLLDDGCWVRAADGGCAVVPVREGLLIPAEGAPAFKRTFDTYAYEGCHMAMCGFIRQGSALLASWTNPYVALDLESMPGLAGAPGGSAGGPIILPRLTLRQDARSVRLVPLGRGDYIAIGRAYRDLAREKGWLVTLPEKIKADPRRAALIGTVNFKLWTALARKIDLEGKEVSCSVNWTFDEVAQIAEHLRSDLELEKVFFMLGGWIHRGYDNQHPDILPAAPECGGNDKLAECSRRIRALGYVFCFHDNYQDIYRDSPSWNEDLIMKTPEGSLAKGGVWLGGQAYLTCSKQAVELARRPQNLPAVKKLFNVDAYFIDTTYAAGLCECFDPKHSLKRQDDMKYKQELSDYSREVFGIFGSECGREWAIPHSDFFEGLVGVSGRYYHDAKLAEGLGASVIPLFEAVYRDCQIMWGKYGYDFGTADSFVAHHVAMGRPIYYHSIGNHLYWKEESGLDVTPRVVSVAPAGEGAFDIAYEWRAGAAPKEDYAIFVHFVDERGEIKFQNDHASKPPTSQWAAGTTVADGPHRAAVPAGLSGRFGVRIGLHKPPRGQRVGLRGPDDGSRRIIAGTLVVEKGAVRFEPPRPAQRRAAGGYCRADDGWAEGMHPTDCFIKNTYEVLSPLHELTALTPPTAHEFLTPQRDLSRTVFGDVECIANLGRQPREHRFADGLDVTLPGGGFAIRSPGFITFHALRWGDVKYDRSTLFTLRSLDGKPLAESAKVRIFHGFGEPKVKLGGKLLEVRREAVVP